MRKIEPGLLKRHVLLFLGAIVAPCLVLVALGVRMIGQERELHAKRIKEGRERLVAQVGQELLSRLERIKSDLLVAPDHVPETVVWTGRVRDGRLLLPWDISPGAQEFRQAIEGHPFVELMRQAEHEELITGKADEAVRLYREALAGLSQPAARAYTRLSLARVLRRIGKREESYEEYRQILSSSPDLVDEHGIPLALYAVPPLLDGGKQQTEALALITGLLERSDGLPPAALYLLRDLAAKLAAGDAVARITNHIRDREQAEALQREFPHLLLPAQDQDTVWLAFGEPPWLVGVAPRPAPADAMAIAVRAREVLAGRPSTADPLELTAGKAGEPLGERFPGLRVKIPADIEGDDSLRQTFLLTATGLVLALTLFAGYLLLRDVRREVRLAELRSQFVSGVSHELKTPLTAIRVFAESMRLDDDLERETQREYLDTILRESERLDRLVSNILDFGQIEHGGKSYQLRPASLADAADAAAQAMRYRLEQSGFQLEAKLDRGLPRVLADRDAIEQAILNLLDNAIKYSGESRKIGLHLEREGDCAIVRVIDHGVGITRSEQQRIFERFYRVPSPENQRIAGAGLGLAIVDHIVKAHGGSLAVDSEPGEGSVFTIRLPLENKS